MAFIGPPSPTTTQIGFSRPSLHFRPGEGSAFTRQCGGGDLLVGQVYVYLSPGDQGTAHNRTQRAGSGNEREAADWSGERVASTALSA